MWWYRVLMPYRSYRRRARYGVPFTELSEVLGNGINVVSPPVPTPVGTDVHTGTGGAGIDDVVPNVPKCPVPV